MDDKLIAGLFIGLAFGLLIGVCIGITAANHVESTELIEPKIELFIKDNQVDTLYIYENN